MFCRNCGTQLKEGAKFCPKCGTPVNSTAGNGVNGDRVPPEKWGGGTQTTYHYQSSAAKKETRIPLFLIGAIVILAAVVVIIFRACSDSGYKKVIKTYMEGNQELDAEKMLSVFPPQVLDAIEDEGYDREEIAEQFEQTLTKSLDTLGADDDFDLEYKIEDEANLSKSMIENIEEEFADEDVNISITDGKSVDLTWTITLDDLGINHEQDMTVEVIKVDGDWYINPFSLIL